MKQLFHSLRKQLESQSASLQLHDSLLNSQSPASIQMKEACSSMQRGATVDTKINSCYLCETYFYSHVIHLNHPHTQGSGNLQSEIQKSVSLNLTLRQSVRSIFDSEFGSSGFLKYFNPLQAKRFHQWESGRLRDESLLMLCVDYNSGIQELAGVKKNHRLNPNSASLNLMGITGPGNPS